MDDTTVRYRHVPDRELAGVVGDLWASWPPEVEAAFLAFVARLHPVQQARLHREHPYFRARLRAVRRAAAEVDEHRADLVRRAKRGDRAARAELDGWTWPCDLLGRPIDRSPAGVERGAQAFRATTGFEPMPDVAA
ncbi:MAG TPA: hypothetical protein VGB14_12870 [Acidimicrobiales bacterium]|jgi:hypothetical protein